MAGLEDSKAGGSHLKTIPKVKKSCLTVCRIQNRAFALEMLLV